MENKQENPCYKEVYDWSDLKAFPQQSFTRVGEVSQQIITSGGMTLRDYFAGKALQGILAGLDMDASEVSDQIACKSYIVADAMLKARA